MQRRGPAKQNAQLLITHLVRVAQTDKEDVYFRTYSFYPKDILDEKVRLVTRNEIAHTLEDQKQHFEDKSLSNIGYHEALSARALKDDVHHK